MGGIAKGDQAGNRIGEGHAKPACRLVGAGTAALVALGVEVVPTLGTHFWTTIAIGLRMARENEWG